MLRTPAVSWQQEGKRNETQYGKNSGLCMHGCSRGDRADNSFGADARMLYPFDTGSYSRIGVLLRMDPLPALRETPGPYGNEQRDNALPVLRRAARARQQVRTLKTGRIGGPLPEPKSAPFPLSVDKTRVFIHNCNVMRTYRINNSMMGMCMRGGAAPL